MKRCVHQLYLNFFKSIKRCLSLIVSTVRCHSHPLKGLKSNTLTIPKIGEIVEQLDLLLVGGDIKLCEHSGEMLAVSYEVLCQEKWKHMFPRRLYLNDHDSLIHNSSNLETSQIFINRRMDKHSPVVVYSCNEILLINKKKKLLITLNNMGEPQKHVVWKKPDTKEWILNYPLFKA